jgi:glutathione S-transferase
VILYDSSFAPNPRRVRIFLAERGVEVPIQQIDIRVGPDLRNLSRWCEVVSSRPSAKA